MATVVARRLQKIATEALDEVLDEQTVEELRDAALTAAGRALGPPTSGEPELPRSSIARRSGRSGRGV